MYLVVKKKGDPVICGSIKAVSQVTKISVHTLYYRLSKLKEKRYKDGNYIVIPSKVIRAK